MLGSKHHISPPSQEGIRFALRHFRSPLLMAYLLVSFPPPTKMLQSGGLLTLTGCPKAGSPIRQSSDLRVLAPPRRISQLDTTFISARAKPFPKQRS